MLCLVANAASGAFGAIGIPVGVVETLKLPGDVSVLGVSQSATLTLAIINFIIPFLLIFIIDGFRGVKETLPAILVVSITYTLTQGLLTVFSGPELADIIPPLLTMLALAVFSKNSNQNTFIVLIKMKKLNLQKHILQNSITCMESIHCINSHCNDLECAIL